MNKVGEILKSYAAITPEIAKEYGISKFQFYKYLRENNYDRVSQGIYVKEDEWLDELDIIHKRCPKAVFSHDEALYYHNLTDRTPIKHTLTIYSGYNAHRIIKDFDCKVYTIKKELLELGKIIVKDNYGNYVPMYDLERTICDLVRNRNTMDVQSFNQALKTYVIIKDKDLNLLMKYAKLFRVQNIIRGYLEVLL